MNLVSATIEMDLADRKSRRKMVGPLRILKNEHDKEKLIHVCEYGELILDVQQRRTITDY